MGKVGTLDDVMNGAFYLDAGGLRKPLI